MLDYIPAIPVIFVFVTVAVLMAPDRSSYWLRTFLGGCALVGGVACFSAASVSVGPDWIQPLGTLPLAVGNEFSQTFAVDHKGTFWVMLADEGYYHRRFAPFLRDNSQEFVETQWHDMSVPWSIGSSSEPVASGTGKAADRHGAYEEEGDPYLVSLGFFDAVPGKQYELSLHVAKSIPELTNEDAVVQIRVDSLVFKDALVRAGLWGLVAVGLIGAGIVLLVFVLVARLRR